MERASEANATKVAKHQRGQRHFSQKKLTLPLFVFIQREYSGWRDGVFE
jgi:hypothetical protein